MAEAFAEGQACVVGVPACENPGPSLLIVLTPADMMHARRYVALSRVRDASGLQILTWRDSSVKANVKVLQFYQHVARGNAHAPARARVNRGGMLN